MGASLARMWPAMLGFVYLPMLWLALKPVRLPWGPFAAWVPALGLGRRPPGPASPSP